MNPSPSRYTGKPTAMPMMLKKAFGESPLLQGLLPKTTLQLASSLSSDDKEVLTYLIEYGRRAILEITAPSSACKSPWKPWKSASMANKREKVLSPCPFSDYCTEFLGFGEDKRNSWLPANHKASSTCDCFSCYSRFWSRWNDSPDRDLINEILDIVEEGPKNCKVKKKKRADKKRAALEAEASAKKPNGCDGNLHHATVPMMNVEAVMDIQISNNTSRPPGSVDDVCVMDGTSHASIMTDEATKIDAQTRTGRKKSMFRVVKQKEEACGANRKSGDMKVNKVSGPTGSDEEALVASGLVGDRANGMESVVSGNFAIEASEIMAAGLSPTLISSKNTTRLHRIAKRRHSQVIPLDCEELSDTEKEQEAAITAESAQAPMSPRAADTGLGGRGFLACVFPDALGRVASRLWDLVSVRLRSRTVEYH